MEKEKTIMEKIVKRQEMLKESPKVMIQNVLESVRPKACLSKLIKEDKVVHNPDKIKKMVVEHFESWTKKREPSEEVFKDWQETYKPKDSLAENVYRDLTREISLEELNNTIKSMPNNKATGKSQISYEMIKFLDHQNLIFLRDLFNKIMEKETVPTDWKTNQIFPISKVSDWNYNITEARPIALLDKNNNHKTLKSANCKQHT